MALQPPGSFLYLDTVAGLSVPSNGAMALQPDDVFRAALQHGELSVPSNGAMALQQDKGCIRSSRRRPFSPL